MSLRERRPHQRRRSQSHKISVETEEERQARLQAAKERRARQRAESTARVVFPFAEWCVLRGFSTATGRRLVAAGRVKVTRLSERRIGIRSDHDQEYLDSRIEGGE